MKLFEKLDMILAILVIMDILLILVSVVLNEGSYVNFIILFDTILCIILIINFIMKYRRATDKKLFFKQNWLDLFASFPVALLILPFLSSTLYTYNAIVLIRILRLLLLFKVLSKFVERFLAATSMDKFIAMLIVVLLGSTLILYFFDPSIVTVFDAVWFVFQTVTTVGFGDVIPSSPLGKFVGLILLINGVLMFSIFTASFAYMFNDRIFKKENDEFNQRVDSLKDNMNETVASIDAIKEKVNSNEVELAEIKENINELSVKIDELIKIIEKKE